MNKIQIKKCYPYNLYEVRTVLNKLFILSWIEIPYFSSLKNLVNLKKLVILRDGSVNLEELDMKNQIKDLQKALPNCEIFY
jgi:hypothetical protein